MNYFDVHVTTRNVSWVLSSIDFVKILRRFMDDKMLIVQMCTAAKRGNKVVWFWQQQDNTIDMYGVLRTGYAKHILHGNGFVRDINVRSYEAHFARINEILPTMVIDFSPDIFERLLVCVGANIKNKMNPGFNKPRSDKRAVSEYELMFSTDTATASGDINTYVTEMKIGPEIGLASEIKVGESQAVAIDIIINGVHANVPTDIQIHKSDVLDIAASSNIIEILRQECLISNL